MQNIKQLNQKSFSKLLIFFFLGLLLSGCISKSNESIQVKYFDLGEPKIIEIENVNLDIVPFTNYSEVNSEMLYRLGKNQVDLDPYNQWVEPPNLLLTTFFKRAITLNYEKKTDISKEPLLITLVVSITAFDIDLENNKAILGTTYKIKYQGQIFLVQNRTFEQNLKAQTPSAFAEAMSLAASDFLSQVCSQVSELKTVIMKEKEIQAKQME